MKIIAILIITVFVIHSLSFSQTCLPEGITFSTQAEIDDFQTNYPNCSMIGGSVIILGDDISNLNGLSILTNIGEDLSIGFQAWGNPMLTNLTGLENITTIEGNLSIMNNSNILNLNGIENLSTVGLGLGIWYNEALTSISGLNNVAYIEETLRIAGNYSLIDLIGLETISAIGGDLFIQNNENLTNLSGLDNIESVEGDITISYNLSMTNLSGIENLNTIGDYLLIERNNSMIDLTGLSSLSTVGNALLIRENDVLESLIALTNITSIGGKLAIEHNNNLQNLIGLENIESNSINNLDISFNPQLNTCEILSVCNYLSNPTGYIEIKNNSIGCNNQEEVEQACQSVGMQENNVKPSLFIYPNPAKEEINISHRIDGIINNVTIYNQLGQEVLHRNEIGENIDISTLGQGVYIVELISNELKIRQKIIIIN